MKWWKGDFHAHTRHSDGVLTPSEFMQQAQREELDFFAITDHNTWTYPEFEASPAITVIAGVEVTVDFGHFNVFSEDAHEPPWVGALPRPWALPDESCPPGASRELLNMITTSGLRTSINHPLLHPWPWTDQATELHEVRFLEIWNDPVWPENRRANPATVDMWTRWLNAGSRITAIGGSDFHNPEPIHRKDGRTAPGHRVGVPATYVLSDENRPGSLLEAVDLRRVYVTMEPMVAMSAQYDGLEAGIGDDLGVVDGMVELGAEAAGPSKMVLELVQNGKVVASSHGRGLVGFGERLAIGAAESGWARVDVRTEHGELVAVTNPVFYGTPDERSDLAYGQFVRESPRELGELLPASTT